MFLVDGELRWSASDLTAAMRCEYAVLRTLDYKLAGQSARASGDPSSSTCRVGMRHEETAPRRAPGGGQRHPWASCAAVHGGKLERRRADDAGRVRGEPDVVYQAAFFDGEFFGYADFVERADDGWLVCDAKLARSAKPRALLQLGAYAEQIESWAARCRRRCRCFSATVSASTSGSPTSSRSSASGGNGCASLLAEPPGERTGRWGDDRIVACGKCAECEHAAAEPTT